VSENERLSQNNAVNNDKLQRGTVVTYLTCGGIANEQIKRFTVESTTEKKLKSVNIWHSYRRKGGLYRALSSTFSNAVAVCTKCTIDSDKKIKIG